MTNVISGSTAYERTEAREVSGVENDSLAMNLSVVNKSNATEQSHVKRKPLEPSKIETVVRRDRFDPLDVRAQVASVETLSRMVEKKAKKFPYFTDFSFLRQEVSIM